MTELDVIKKMGDTGDCDTTLAYDGTLGEYILNSVVIEPIIVENLELIGLIYVSQVVAGGSAQLYDLTDEGKEYYEKNK
jgi:hypothetical protein